MTRYRKFTNINESYHVLRRNIAATSLKISFANLHSVKRCDETNLIYFALSIKFSWDLTYFDEFYIEVDFNHNFVVTELIYFEVVDQSICLSNSLRESFHLN